MDPENIPPIIGNTETAETPRSVPRWRWWVHVLVLSLLPLLAGVAGLSKRTKLDAKLLPENIAGLLTISVDALVSFGVLLGIAWLASRVNARQLLLKWRGSWQPILWGALASILLRIGVALIMAVPVMLWYAISGHGEYS